MSTFPPLTADTFGSKYMTANYGYVLMGLGIGSVIASLIAGHYKNIANEAGDIDKMFPAFVIASCCAVAGIILMLVLKRMNK